MGTTKQDKNQEGNCAVQPQDSNRTANMTIDQEPQTAVPITRRSHQYRCPDNRGCDIPTQNKRKAGGVRRARRNENLSFLLGLVESEEVGEGVDFCQLMEPTVTAFTELFMQHDKMKIWNDFINHPEEEQERLLSADRQTATMLDNDAVESQDLDDSWEQLKDNRAVHPAFGPEDCFKRIDNRMKAFLRKRQVPRGTLEYLEADVTAFFEEWPSSVLVSKLNSSFERMLLHTLCQYLDLRSRSFDDDNGGRQTEVENKHDHFTPPKMPLTKYLDTRH